MENEKLSETTDKGKIVDKLAIGMLSTMATILVTGGVEKAYEKLVVERRNHTEDPELED